jgi:uncharacterized protein (TIGR03546 family)
MAFTPWSQVKKVLKILKSSLSPNQIAFSFALGIFAGLPPIGLHIIVPMTIALLVRCSFRAFLLSMGLFKLLSLLVAPGSYAIGRYLLDTHRGLDAMWRVLFHLPVAAPMGYGRYLLFGSLVLSLLVAIPVFFAVRVLTIKYRKSFATWVSGWAVSRRLRGRRGMSALRWLLTGGEAKYRDADRPWGPFRFVRKEMLVILPAVYALCYLIAAVIVPFFAGRIATSAAAFVIGGEVAVERSSFSLFTGRLDLTDLSIQDPNKPDENVLQAPSLTLDAGMLPLLQKRVVFNAVEIGDVFLHVRRQADGTLNVDDFSQGWNAEGYVEWAVAHANDVDWLTLLRRFVDYLGQPRPRKADLSRYSGGRSLPGFAPSFAVERVEIGRVHLTLDDARRPDEPFPPLLLRQVEISNLAAPARLSRDPVEVRLTGQVGDDPQASFAASARFDDRGSVPVHTYHFEMRDVDLTRFSWLYGTTLPFTVASGRGTLTATLTLTGDAASGEASVAFEDLQIAQREGQTLFGLSPQLTAQAVEGLNRYAREVPLVFSCGVEGRADAPTVHYEKPLLEAARQGLAMEGRRELQGTIDALGARIGALAPASDVPLASGYGALREQADRAVQGFLGEAPVQTASDATDLFKGLFERLVSPPAVGEE